MRIFIFDVMISYFVSKVVAEDDEVVMRTGEVFSIFSNTIITNCILVRCFIEVASHFFDKFGDVVVAKRGVRWKIFVIVRESDERAFRIGFCMMIHPDCPAFSMVESTVYALLTRSFEF